MARTTAAAVKEVLLDAYGPKEDGTEPSLAQFIDSANAVVSRVKTCATSRGNSLTTAELKLIETWLSAHFYAMSDQTYASENTDGASATYHGQTGMRLEATKFGQTAVSLDPSGCLSAIAGAKRARGVWLGKPPSTQVDYVDRD